MDEVFENINSCNSKDFEDVFQIKKWKLERRNIMIIKKKMKRTWRRDIINNIYDVIFFDWLKNDWREYYLYIDVRYIMDSHHTNKT